MFESKGDRSGARLAPDAPTARAVVGSSTPMTDRRRRRSTVRIVAGLLSALLVSACASNRVAPPVPPEAAHPRSVAIIPVTRSNDLSLNRRSLFWALGVIPIGLERLDRYTKQQSFEKALEADRLATSRALTASLLAAAQRRGYDAEILDESVRNPDDPDDFDYPRIRTEADVIIHVRISDMWLSNLMMSTDYEPYVDADVRFVTHASGYEMLDENFHYGVNGAKGDPYSVPSDIHDRWPDFQAVLAHPDDVGRSWAKGAEALGGRIIAKLPPPPGH